jgi:O-antigen/teichoic acid export membrane protein
MQHSKNYEAKGLPLRSNFTWMLSGNVIFGASQWAFIVIIAKLGTPELLGKYALGLAICTPVVLFTNMQLRSVQATDMGNINSFIDYLGVRLCSSFLAVVVILFILALAGYDVDTSLVVCCYGMFKATESISDIAYGYFQKLECLDNIAISMMLRAVLSLTGFWIAFKMTNSLVVAILTSIICAVIVILCWDIRRIRMLAELRGMHEGLDFFRYFLLKAKANQEKIKRIVFTSLPLGIGAVILSLANNVPRYFIERVQSEYELGIFSALAYFMLTGVTVIHALGQSVMPRLAGHAESNDYKGFKRLLIKVCLLGAVIGLLGIIICWFFGRELLVLIYSTEYEQYSTAFLILMFSAALSYVASFLSYALLAVKQYKMQLYANTLSLLFAVMGSVQLIPKYSVKGAAFTMLLIYASLLGFNLVFLIVSSGVLKRETLTLKEIQNE